MFRKLCQRELVTQRTAERALSDLSLVRLSVVPFGDIAQRIWQLRANLSACDAAFVAVAELLDVPLLTFDSRVRSAPGTHCAFVAV